MFQRVAIVEAGGAAMRCVRSIGAAGPRDTAPAIVLLHRGAAPPVSLRRRVDAVVQRTAGPDRSDHRTPHARDVTALAADLERTGTDAVWVGWGAPEDHLTVARACEARGVTFVGPPAAALSATADHTALARHLAAAGLAPPSRGPRSPGQVVEVQLLIDRAGTCWTLGTLVHAAPGAHGQPLLSWSGQGLLDDEVAASCARTAATAARALGLSGAVAVEFPLPGAHAPAAITRVRGHLTPAHLLTELLTGRDLVAMQFALASGSLLGPEPDPPSGVAVCTTLRLTERAPVVPPTTSVVHLRTPFLPGLRCDPLVEEGDEVSTAVGTELLTLGAVGRDPTLANRRLAGGVAGAYVVLGAGATDRAAVLDRLGATRADAAAAPTAAPDSGQDDDATRTAIAIVVAAIELDAASTARDRQRFLTSAARGRPTANPEGLRTIDLQVTGNRYRGRISCTGPRTCDLSIDGHHLVATLEHGHGPERTVRIGGHRATIIWSVQGTDRLVEVDGQPIRVTAFRDGTVRAPLPGIVLRHLVEAGDVVAAGDPVAVLESMKLETVLSAPLAGRVEELLRARHTRLAAGDGVLRIEPLHATEERRRPSPRARFEPLVSGAPGGDHPDPRVQAARRLLRLVLGYDRPTTDPDNLRRSVDRDRVAAAAATPEAIAAEREVLQAFADLTALAGHHRDATDGQDVARSDSDQLRTYLRTLDPDAEPLSEGFRTTLLQALRHLGVTSLDRTPGLEDALYRLHLAQQRAPGHRRAVLVLLGRWHDELDGPEGELAELVRGTLDQLVRAADQREPAIGDLARRTRYQLFDRSRIRAERALLHDEVRRQLHAVTRESDRERRAAAMASLVASTEPLLPVLLDPSVPQDVLSPMLELLIRRYYRRRAPAAVRRVEGARTPTVVADLETLHGRTAPERIIAVGGDHLDTLLAGAAAVAGQDDDRYPGSTALDVYLRTTDPPTQPDVLAAALRTHLHAVAVPAGLARVTITTLDTGTPISGTRAIEHLSFQRLPEGWTEQRHLRGIHPLVADRLDLWRFERFELTRLPSADEVYLFRATARQDPSDLRLFVLAEVRDLTATLDPMGTITALPELERVLSACLEDLRRARATLPVHELPVWNRVVLHLWPAITMPLTQLEGIVGALSPLAHGLGLEEVTLLVRTPNADGTPVRRCLRLTPGSGQGMSLRITNPPRRPLRPVDAPTSRVISARRRGIVHPTEVLPWLLTAPDTPQQPTRHGSFVEYDLDATGALQPVDRELGSNTAGVVVGVVTTPTTRYPDGMTRVAVLSDPTHELGSLAEPECRRIIAALDLAAALQVPVEWFPVSSGARVAMDSGTENLDWTARVLRRIVGFTQSGGEINIVVAGINVGAQPYWNALSTMLMHTTGALIMTPGSAMVLTGTRALEYSGGVSADDDIALGGYDRVMGPNGQAQYWAPDLRAACALLLRHHDLTYVAPGGSAPRRLATADPHDRDVRAQPHRGGDTGFATIGDIFSDATNPDRKKPFDIRSVLRAVIDQDRPPLERWADMAAAETAVVFHAQLGGRPIMLLGVESRTLSRREPAPADGPQSWSAGTLFPRSSKKMAQAINAASGRRPLVVLANLSGFDGSPESLRERQLEYGAEIGRAVVNFRGPMVFCVISRYHGGAFVVFAKTLNPALEVVALEGAHASVIGGAPAAAVVFTREVERRTMRDARVVRAREHLDGAVAVEVARHRDELHRTIAAVRSQMLGAVAAEFDRIHDIDRAVAVGSVDRVLTAAQLRPYLIDAVERGLAATR